MCDFYDLNETQKKLLLEASLDKGRCVSKSEGVCGEVYVFDHGENVTPRYSCAKFPKRLGDLSLTELNSRFVNELRIQLSLYHHKFVHWAFDFTEVMGVPVAQFRYWGTDLNEFISREDSSDIEKLSIMTYICSGLEHCYENGLVSHQDLKPANIFLRDVTSEFHGLPDLDIYTFALVADFGLANTSITASNFNGSRPYMAPEQWNKSKLSPKTDIFALGVILYQLMSDGFHPVGIKLEEHWPNPVNGNSKKWTAEKSWRNWAKKSEVDSTAHPVLDTDVLVLVKKMLLIDPIQRPSVSEVKLTLLSIIKAKSVESHTQLTLLLKHFEEQVTNEPLNKKWPYLFKKWQDFEKRFGK